jgi:hypothetical protein
VDKSLAMGAAISDAFIANKLKSDPDITTFDLKEILRHS